MTDPAATDKPLFEMVPTSQAYLELVTQVAELHDDVAHLQANSLALPGDTDTDTDTEDDGDNAGHVIDPSEQIEQLGYRIDRHRAEIEEIKRRVNQIIRFLGSTGIPQTPPADGDTITPTTAGAA